MTLQQRKSLAPWLYDSVEYYQYQLDGVRQLARLQNWLLADDMGLGKSLQALTVAAIDVTRGWAEKIIVVAPVNLKGNWCDEVEKFTTFPYMAFGIEENPNRPGHYRKLGPKDRAIQLARWQEIKGPKILIVNYEQVIPHLQDFNKIGFDIGIYDEAHYIKNFKAKRTKAALNLNTTRSFLLTGTPMLNHVNELWPLLHKIDPSGYPKYWGFLNRYAVWGGYENKQIVAVKNEKELTERLKRVMVRRLKEDVLDLPDVQYIQRWVDLSEEQRKIYDKVEEELQINMVDLNEPSEIENALVKFLRLKQVCGTLLPFTGEDISAKLDLAISDALELLANGHKIIIFTQFRDVLECFCNRLDLALPGCQIFELHGGVPTQDRHGVVQAWSKEKRPAVIAGMLQVMKEGYNMTAARHVFFVDKLFVPGLNRQGVDRAHRIGSDLTQPVQVYEYLCRKTKEQRVEQILRTKVKLQKSIIEDSDFRRRLVAALKEDDDAA